MTYRQLFFVEGRLLGETPRSLVFVHAELQAPMSYLFFCQDCGEVYARCPVVRSDGVISKWQSFRRICSHCAEHSKFLNDWPGCITLSWDYDFTEAFPMPVLQYELERHIQHYERIHNG